MGGEGGVGGERGEKKKGGRLKSDAVAAAPVGKSSIEAGFRALELHSAFTTHPARYSATSKSSKRKDNGRKNGQRQLDSTRAIC